MLKAYLLSILIWMAIIVFIILCTKDRIIENGWLDGAEPSTLCRGFLTLIAVSATPIFRFLICVAMMYMATETKEQYEEKYKDEDDD